MVTTAQRQNILTSGDIFHIDISKIIFFSHDGRKLSMHIDSANVTLREARPEDDEQICVLIRSISMPGPVSLTMDCSPSFFSSIEVEGFAQKTMVIEAGQKIVGICLMSKRTIFMNGKPADVGYISSLRLDKSISGIRILSRGLQLARQWHKNSFNVPFYLGAILDDNVAARKPLTSGRAGLPDVRLFGTLYTAGIPLLKRKHPIVPAGMRIERGSVIGAERIVEFLDRVGRQKQFFPVYTKKDILADEGILRGKDLNDFYVAERGNRICGVMASWNQLPYRRRMVTDYSTYARLFKPVIKSLCKVLRLAPIPEPGEPLRNIYASCIAIENNNRELFKLLLNTILCDLHGTGHTLLLAGLMEGDPLLPELKKFIHFPFRTGIYTFSLEKQKFSVQLDGRAPYVELASL